jgi:hypothetical protein
LQLLFAHRRVGLTMRTTNALMTVVLGIAALRPSPACAQTTRTAVTEAPLPAGGVRLATERSTPARVVSVDVRALLLGGLVVEYEHAFTPSFALLGGVRAQLVPAPIGYAF